MGPFGPWTLPGAGCKGLRGGGDCRLSTFPKYFNAHIYFLSSQDRVSLWGKLRVYSSVFLSGHPSPTSLTILFAALLGANLAGSRRGSAGFDPRFPVIPDLAGLRKEDTGSSVPAWPVRGDRSPPNAQMPGEGRRRAEMCGGTRVLHKPGASLSFLGDTGDGSYDLFPTFLHPYTLHLVFLSLREPNPQSSAGRPLPLGNSNSAPNLLPIEPVLLGP